MRGFPVVCAALLVLAPGLSAQDHDHAGEPVEGGPHHDGWGGGVLKPELFVTGAWGIFEPGSGPGGLSNSEHDPLSNGTLQAVELHLLLNLADRVTGGVYGFGHLTEDRELEAEFEEGYLHFHVTDGLAVGGGQFLNTVGSQNERHLHAWDFVNQNLMNSRFLNGGELITQGGEILLSGPGGGMLTLGGGGVRTHAHEHAHEEHGAEEEEEHFMEADEAGFNDWVFSLDSKIPLPFDPAALLSASFLAGENGFGRHTRTYGVGVQKVWNGQDDGPGGVESGPGAFLARVEFLQREVEASVLHEDGEEPELSGFSDRGFSTALFYGLADGVTLSLRHDWVSEVEEAELAETHRISPALTAYLGTGQRVRARVQYDWIQSEALESEHAAWLQLQWTWGGEGGSHAGHSH